MKPGASRTEKNSTLEVMVGTTKRTHQGETRKRRTDEEVTKQGPEIRDPYRLKSYKRPTHKYTQPKKVVGYRHWEPVGLANFW